MRQHITIIDGDYSQWVVALSSRYRHSQVRTAVKVNQELLRFYWELGRDIVEMHAEERWGNKFMSTLSADLLRLNPNVAGFSVRNIYYCKYFYLLYNQTFEILPQVGAKLDDTSNEFLPQAGAKIEETMFNDLFMVPWGHHKLIIDKCGDDVQKAFFYVRQTVKDGLSRSVLMNVIGSKLYERNGKALTNFAHTLPSPQSDLAQELTKDPYNFAFAGITEPYNERLLKNALLNNITNFLVELGTGFAYVGKEFCLHVGETENFIDLLFYNLNLSCYVVVEVKIGKFNFQDVGQLGGYVVACNHQLRKEGRDNPTIGLLICKEKDRIQAQYALESSSQPIGISEYDIERFYPAKIEGKIPTIEEIETKLNAICQGIEKR